MSSAPRPAGVSSGGHDLPTTAPTSHDSFTGGQRRRRDGDVGLQFSGTPSETADETPPRPSAWWKIKLFRGIVNDIRRRAPYYASDWTDAWDYRVVPATVYMYFAKYVCIVEVTVRLTDVEQYLSGPGFLIGYVSQNKHAIWGQRGFVVFGAGGRGVLGPGVSTTCYCGRDWSHLCLQLVSCLNHIG